MNMDDRRGGFRRMVPPVKVGDELEVKIESVGEKGDGVAKVSGFVLFVPGAKEGQTVKVKVTRVLRKVGFAEIVGEGAAGVSEESAEGTSEETSEESYEESPATEEATEEAEAPVEESEESEDSETFGEETETE